jgi:hypothetical protein
LLQARETRACLEIVNQVAIDVQQVDAVFEVTDDVSRPDVIEQAGAAGFSQPATPAPRPWRRCDRQRVYCPGA